MNLTKILIFPLDVARKADQRAYFDANLVLDHHTGQMGSLGDKEQHISVLWCESRSIIFDIYYQSNCYLEDFFIFWQPSGSQGIF